MSAPPLLMLAQGRRPRPRAAPAPKPKELALHLAVADILRRFCRPDWRWGHYPAGEHRDIRTAAKLKAMGVQRGWPDILIFSPQGALHALELKRCGETLTEDQEVFAQWCGANGVPHNVAESLDDALQALRAWDCLRIGLASGRAGQ